MFASINEAVSLLLYVPLAAVLLLSGGSYWVLRARS